MKSRANSPRPSSRPPVLFLTIMLWHTRASQAQPVPSNSSEAQSWNIEAVMADHPAPPETYLCMWVDLPQANNLKITRIEPLSHEDLVHHMLLFGAPRSACVVEMGWGRLEGGVGGGEAEGEGVSSCSLEREIYFKSHISLYEYSSHFRLIGRGVCSFSASVQSSLFGLPQGTSPGPHVKDQESNPRPHTPRPAALPVKVEQ